MISDCGNKLNSVKFYVWLLPSGGGWVEVAWLSKPNGVDRKYWKKRFNRFEEMPAIVLELENRVRRYENRRTSPIQHTQYVCPRRRCCCCD